MTVINWIIFLVFLCGLYGLIWLIIAPIEWIIFWIIFFVLFCGLYGLIWLVTAPKTGKTDEADDFEEEVRKQRVRERLYKEMKK